MSRKTSSKLISVSSAQSNLPDTLKTTTPTSHRKLSESDYSFSSPIFSPYTQEESDNVDVVWDWSSSQSNTRPRKHKRLDFTQSPKLAIKRQPSNNQIADFIKLKEELEMLTDDICSNKLENKGKQPVSTNKSSIELEDAFNDCMEDQLVVCSQEIEKKVNMNLNSEFSSDMNVVSSLPSNVKTDITFNSSDNLKKTEVTSMITKLDDTLEKLANDSFDYFLQSVRDEDIKTNSLSKPIDNIASKYLPNTIQDKTTTSLEEEIERKRKEALMKLESKKKHLPSEESPIKCSPEEIEQKRLQALAKLEAKRKQEIIERNRLEALKRLELNKKKRALQFDNSSIFYKLNR